MHVLDIRYSRYMYIRWADDSRIRVDLQAQSAVLGFKFVVPHLIIKPHHYKKNSLLTI